MELLKEENKQLKQLIKYYQTKDEKRRDEKLEIFKQKKQKLIQHGNSNAEILRIDQKIEKYTKICEKQKQKYIIRSKYIHIY